MKWLPVLLLSCAPLVALGQLKLVPEEATQAVFSGEGRPVRVVFRNDGGQTAETSIRVRLLQASSTTVVPLGETAWKRLQVLPGQSILESASLAFPAVRAATRFVVQWVDEGRRVLGRTDVMVYPPGLLKELAALAGEKGLGVLDPGDRLKPLLREVNVEFADLERTGLQDFSGRLAILGPFASNAEMGTGLSQSVSVHSKEGLATVWIQAPTANLADLRPSFYPVHVGEGAVVISQAGLVAGLATNPIAQLNLVGLARAAIRPEPLELPQPKPRTQD
jgi:hypothetical protein